MTRKKTKVSPQGKAHFQTVKWAWLYPLLLSVAALLLAYGVIVGQESDYLFRVQELNLFLYTPLFWQQQMALPGGLLTWLGSYFTQYFYHPWLGAALLCGWCGVLMALVYKAFALKPHWAPVLLIPLALVLLMDFTMGYWIYYLKLWGWPFVGVIGFSLALALVWLFRLLPKQPWVHVACLLLTAVVTYPLMGFYGLLAVLLMAVISWRLEGARLSLRVVDSVTAAVLLVFIPLLYIRYAYSQVPASDAWRQALPLFSKGPETFDAYYWPYTLMCLLLVVLILSGEWREVRGERIPSSRKSATGVISLHSPLSTLHSPLTSLLLLAAVGYGCWHYWYQDANFHDEIRMSNCIGQADWEGVLDVARDAENPTRQMVMCKHLAFFKLGRAGNEMYAFRDGDNLPDSPFRFPIVETIGRQLYLHYGLPNFCHRWCMEEGVETGFRLDHLKDLLRCAVLCGEEVVARQYIDILRQTRYYGAWAEHYEPLLGDSAALARDPELGPITHLTGYPNVLASDKSQLEAFLTTILSARQTTDPVCADLTLMFALQSKDIRLFWRALNQYATLHPDEVMPRHYQEAAYLYGQLDRQVDTSQMPFDQDIPQRYQDFMALGKQYAAMGPEGMKAACYPRFGNTYFYHFYFH